MNKGHDAKHHGNSIRKLQANSRSHFCPSTKKLTPKPAPRPIPAGPRRYHQLGNMSNAELLKLYFEEKANAQRTHTGEEQLTSGLKIEEIGTSQDFNTMLRLLAFKAGDNCSYAVIGLRRAEGEAPTKKAIQQRFELASQVYKVCTFQNAGEKEQAKETIRLITRAAEEAEAMLQIVAKERKNAARNIDQLPRFAEIPKELAEYIMQTAQDNCELAKLGVNMSNLQQVDWSNVDGCLTIEETRSLQAKLFYGSSDDTVQAIKEYSEAGRTFITWAPKQRQLQAFMSSMEQVAQDGGAPEFRIKLIVTVDSKLQLSDPGKLKDVWTHELWNTKHETLLEETEILMEQFPQHCHFHFVNQSFQSREHQHQQMENYGRLNGKLQHVQHRLCHG